MIQKIYVPDMTCHSCYMSYGLLFIAGFLTSLHCISMCGGIAISQGVSKSRKQGFQNSLLYNLGRILSYTLIGGIAGLLGSVLTPSPAFKTGLHIVVGAFMLLLGLKMLGWIDFKLPSTGIPRLKDKVRLPIKTPFFVGLLNGLMPCGPLQTMHMYAMGIASFVVGVLSMLSFALGTSFLMIVMSLPTERLGRNFVQASQL